MRRPFVAGAAVLSLALFLPLYNCSGSRHPELSQNHAAAPQSTSGVTKPKIASAMELPLSRGEFPNTVKVPMAEGSVSAAARYTIEGDSQGEMEKIFNTYRPDYGAFVAMDASTGRILSMVSYTRKPTALGNLALKTIFPSASVFKIVTAAAAIDRERLSPESLVTFTGSNHTLYRRNTKEDVPRRWARHMTLREAFGKSVNTVFARVGLFILKPFELEEYARRFAFNQAIAADVPVQPGRFAIPDGDPFSLAEIASGYNRTTQISPLQGAMIAASVANDGIMMEPQLIDTLTGTDGKELYNAEAKQVSVTMAPGSAEEMRALMRETVRRGTSRKYFATLLRKRSAADLDVGGKTGSLTSLTPRGKCDWFVGYARRGDKKIAVAALTVNEDTWRVKSSHIARSYIEREFTDVTERSVAQASPRRRHRSRRRG